MTRSAFVYMGQGDIYHPGPREDLGTVWCDRLRPPAGPGRAGLDFYSRWSRGVRPHFGTVPITIGEPTGKALYSAKYFVLSSLARIKVP